MFGELRAFHLLVDNNEIGKNKGVAFVEFFDPNMTDVDIAGLARLEVCGLALICERASKGRSWDTSRTAYTAAQGTMPGGFAATTGPIAISGAPMGTALNSLTSLGPL